jgi:hypothetical protein
MTNKRSDYSYSLKAPGVSEVDGEGDRVMSDGNL